MADLAPAYPDAGNAGMLDIVAALRWVRDNIGEFGGDASNVTIFGQSGGGGKVSVLMAMPAAQGLFHKAIVQSGSYYLQAMSAEEGTRQTAALLAALELKPADAATLASIPVDRLVEGLGKAMRGPARASYRPVVDGRNLPAGPWAPDAPAMTAGVPMIIGTTATEMTLLTGAREPDTFTLDEAGLRKRLAAWFLSDDIDKVIATFSASRPKATPSDIFFAVATDKAMREGAWQQAERKAQSRTAPRCGSTNSTGPRRWTAASGARRIPSTLPWCSTTSPCRHRWWAPAPEAQAVADQMSSPPGSPSPGPATRTTPRPCNGRPTRSPTGPPWSSTRPRRW